MRLIPGKTRVKIELFRGITLGDIVIVAVMVGLAVTVFFSTIFAKEYIAFGIVVLGVILVVRINDQPNYMLLISMVRYLSYFKKYRKKRSAAKIAAEGAEEGKADGGADNSGDELSDNMLPVRHRLSPDGTADENADTAEKTVADTAEKTDADTAEKADADTAEKADADTAEKTVADTAEKTVAGTAEKTVAGNAEKTVADTAEKAVADTAEKTVAGTAEKAVADGAEKKPGAAKASSAKDYKKIPDIGDIMPFTGFKDGFIDYAGKYLGAVIEISPVEFRFFSEHRRNASIEVGLGKVIRSLRAPHSANIVKIDRPIIYESFLKKEYANLEELKASYRKGFLSEEELKSRVEIQYDRIYSIRDICFENKVIQPFYYLVLFNSDKTYLEIDVDAAITSLRQGEMPARRISDEKELAIFLRYTNYMDFDENEIDSIDPKDYIRWAMPDSLSFTSKRVDINNIVTHQMRVISYPSSVGDAWLAGVMSIPATKVMVKFTPIDKARSVRTIDVSLSELRVQLGSTFIDSKRIELESHIATLEKLLATLQLDNESLIMVNIYVSMFDGVKTAEWGHKEQMERSSLPMISDMKKTVRRHWLEQGMKLSPMDFAQIETFIASQVSAYDPFKAAGRPMPSNTVAAMYPWIFAHVSDEGGIRLGTQDGVPVFINFFRRDSERVNSNMVIIGKSGAGKSYGTKSLLTNLASEDAKIFILDPENEYMELAHTLHGKMINVGNSTAGRLNPFHIIASLDDSDDGTAAAAKGTGFLSHLQFLEEFFRQILPDLEKDAFEYLISLIERLYTNFDITMETDLTKLGPLDYPVFDDLYDLVLEDFQRNNVEYIRKILQSLINYVSKFAAGGRNSNIWNGPSSITTDENFTVFNFQSLLANRNTTIANAQMLLVLKYLDNEIIKNREYNRRYGLNRKIVVVIDEAHVFIDTKFPVALDFMFQLAKRIRKYNGMQIVITQNIKDFVGSEEIARKSTAIINACQYSFIFGLAPNDIDDLCRLYEKAGGINEVEQDQILTAPRGMAFTVMSPSSRSTFKISVPQTMVDMFEQPDYQTHYFNGEEGAAIWEKFIAGSREEHDANAGNRISGYVYETREEEDTADVVTYSELSEDEAEALAPEDPKHRAKAGASGDDDGEAVSFSEDDGEETAVPDAPAAPAVPVQTVPAAPAVDMASIVDTIRSELKREMTVQIAEQIIDQSVARALAGGASQGVVRPAAPLEKKPAEEKSLDDDLFDFTYTDGDAADDDDFDFDFDGDEENEPDELEGFDDDGSPEASDDLADLDDLVDDDDDDPDDLDDDDLDDLDDFDDDDDDDDDELDEDDLNDLIIEEDDDDEDEEPDDFDSLDELDEPDDIDDEDKAVSQGASETGGEGPGFNLGAVLSKHLQDYRNKSLDERMKETNVRNMIITIDDLDKYIKDMRKKRYEK